LFKIPQQPFDFMDHNLPLNYQFLIFIIALGTFVQEFNEFVFLQLLKNLFLIFKSLE
jgi:hypothetical protein